MKQKTKTFFLLFLPEDFKENWDHPVEDKEAELFSVVFLFSS